MADYLIRPYPPLSAPGEIHTRTMPDACRRARELSIEHPGIPYDVIELPRGEIHNVTTLERGPGRAPILHARYCDGTAVS